MQCAKCDYQNPTAIPHGNIQGVEGPQGDRVKEPGKREQDEWGKSHTHTLAHVLWTHILWIHILWTHIISMPHIIISPYHWSMILSIY